MVRQSSRRGAPKGTWLAQMLARKPKMLVTVALANKMARIVWALLAKGGSYRAQVACSSVTLTAITRRGGERKETYGATVGETGPGQPGLSTVPRARFG